MRIAIVHDIFVDFGGAERVLLALLDLYPSADVFIPLLTSSNKKILRQHTRGRIVSPWFSSVSHLRWAQLVIKSFIFFYWKSLDLTQYDLVISSSHSFSSHSVSVGRHTLHVSYIHTPPRYLYGQFNETQIINRPFFRAIFSPLMAALRKQDINGASRPKVLIANSRTVQKRIKKYYHRGSIVVYPPVTTPVKNMKREPRYFLCMSRLVKQKGIDLAIRACNSLNERLVVVGKGPEEPYLRSIAGPTIKFVGFVPDGKISGVFAGAKALLYPSIDEDFGIVPVEAMAHGVPVIGHNSGGTAETVVEGKTGFLFDDWTVESLTQAMHTFSTTRFHPPDLIRHAKKFSRRTFTSSFARVVEAALRL